ncbi:zinc finger protein CONSTANS-LIKE 3-like [Impatiens glandulifera]|uniref:zinc finger protein CONSTANS-LIKE 3-like n=1 Tax=Impatiens glandulifera TaxID=253017 RepID=UPI001FB18084|nr:zinc finger protein CONSTANS-LIKE 3-like [Impatiens glandulifera]
MSTGEPSSTMTISLPLNIGYYDSSLSSSASSWKLMHNNGGMNNTACSSNSSYETTFMQGSVSSLSLHKINARAPPPHFIWSNVVNSLDFLDSSSSSSGGTIPVKRDCSTGDLQGINMLLQYYRRSESQLISNEESCSSIMEGMSKACRYSPEEKRERIHKYRTKRNLRNFNKTIKYACRKTLADSRPRIRGRFARNDDHIEKLLANHYHHHQQPDNEDHEEENWTSFLEAFSSDLIP